MSDEQWELIRKHFPDEHYPDDRPGRKPIPARRVLEAVLWILNTGAQWHMLPQSYPNYKTVHRRFHQWCENEVIRAALTELANTLRAECAIDESECYIDATFASAKGDTTISQSDRLRYYDMLAEMDDKSGLLEISAEQIIESIEKIGIEIPAKVRPGLLENLASENESSKRIYGECYQQQEYPILDAYLEKTKTL